MVVHQVSSTGSAIARSGPSRSAARRSAVARSPSVGLSTTPARHTTGPAVSAGGISGTFGRFITRNAVVTASGALRLQRSQRFSSSGPCEAGQKAAPVTTRAAGNSPSSIAVTTPRPPPPPRSAQNSSGSAPAETRWNSPAGVTSSTARTLFTASPARRP